MPNNPPRFLQHKNSFRRYLANDLTCAARKTKFKTRKRFHNKQYTPKSKDQPFESDRTHFDTGFNKNIVAMYRPTIIFLLSHKITTVQSKTVEINNHINQPQNQSGNTITTNNPRNHSIKNIQKTNRQNKHEKLSHQLTAKSRTKTTTTNNPHNLSIKNTPKTNTTSNYEKMQCFLNILK